MPDFEASMACSNFSNIFIDIVKHAIVGVILNGNGYKEY